MLPGPLLIADLSNHRLIVVSPQGRTRWQFPQLGDLAPGRTLLTPDDAFFTPDGKCIIATEEDNFVVSVISIARHKIIFRCGTPGQSGMGPNQLWSPDDAMMLPDGYTLSPDIKNCRILHVKTGTLPPVRHLRPLDQCLHPRPAQSAILQFDPATAMAYSAGSLPLAYSGATSAGSDIPVVGGKTTGGGNSSRAILLRPR